MFNHPLYFSDEQITNFRHFIAENSQNIEYVTSQIVSTMDFKLHLCGVNYLRDAIAYCYHLPAKTKINFNGEVYPFIAQKHNSKTRNVERNIRTAIQTCYNEGRMLEFNDICGYDLVSKRYPPTVSEFVVRVVNWIKTVEAEYSLSIR